jgi:hypothetical protein
VVFLALRWMVAALGGLAVAALLGAWGHALGEAVRHGPLAVVDRAGGMVVGGAQGLILVVFLVLVALSIEVPRDPGDRVAQARLSEPLMWGAGEACTRVERYVPGSDWLRGRFWSASRRVARVQRDAAGS